MPYLLKDRTPVPELDDEIQRLRRLLRDLEFVRSGRHPDRNQLASAPLIDDWRIVNRPAPCLMGTVKGHPTIKNGHTGLTTELWLLAPTLGYARTLSRYYAMGRPALDDASYH